MCPPSLVDVHPRPSLLFSGRQVQALRLIFCTCLGDSRAFCRRWTVCALVPPAPSAGGGLLGGSEPGTYWHTRYVEHSPMCTCAAVLTTL